MPGADRKRSSIERDLVKTSKFSGDDAIAPNTYFTRQTTQNWGTVRRKAPFPFMKK